MKSFIRWLLALLLPEPCLLCHESYISTNSDLTRLICYNCQQQVLPWAPVNEYQQQQLFALFYYQPPIDYFVSQLKFQDQLIYARLFSQCFMARLQQRTLPMPECLIPVPLHKTRLRERGFNQAVEIAKPLAKQLKIPLDITSCQRDKYTEPQTHLHARDRQENVRNAFKLIQPIPYKHVAILDDVVTTGSTVNALMQLLKNHGIETVEVWCVALTPFSSANTNPLPSLQKFLPTS